MATPPPLPLRYRWQSPTRRWLLLLGGGTLAWLLFCHPSIYLWICLADLLLVLLLLMFVCIVSLFIYTPSKPPTNPDDGDGMALFLLSPLIGVMLWLLVHHFLICLGVGWALGACAMALGAGSSNKGERRDNDVRHAALGGFATGIVATKILDKK